MLTLWRCQCASPFQGTQGPQELNPHFARSGAGPPNRWLIPITKNRPEGASLGRFLATRIRSYPGTSAVPEASFSCGWRYHPRELLARSNIMDKG